jgi:hypothetical protein
VTLADRARLVRMPGSSIAAPTAVGWVTDFLNARTSRGPADARDVDDLRLAFCVLTTRWQRKAAGRLGAADVVAFHRAFGLDRLRSLPRLTLDRERVLAGAARLHGDWFPDAVADPERRAHGIAFPTVARARGLRPAMRRAHAAVGALTPPQRRPASSAGRTTRRCRSPRPIARRAHAPPERWPDVAAEGGRFTALRRGGLDGQTFEIEIVAIPPRARRSTPAAT